MKKRTLVPDYIYSARTSEEILPFFEQEYYKQADRYDNYIHESEEHLRMTGRIAHVFFKTLREKWSLTQNDDMVSSLGNEKYEWKFVKPLLNEKSVIYAFGAGTDISFETQLIDEVGCDVYCFDPTPQAVEYVVPIARENPKLLFHPVGALAVDGVAKFYKPTAVGAGSLSSENLQHGSIYMEAPVKRLRTLMNQFKHKRIDYLKIDIEGAEHGVLDDMLFAELDVTQIGVEFDQPIPPWRIEKTIHKLMLANYELLSVWGLNCLFVKRDAVAGLMTD